MAVPAPPRLAPLCLAWLSLSLLSHAVAATPSIPLDQRPAWQSARQALSEFVPEIALQQLDALRAEANLSEAERQQVELARIEAMVRAERFQQALDACTPELHAQPPARYWCAQALIGLKREPEALQLLDSLAPEQLQPTLRDWLPIATALARRGNSTGELSLPALQELSRAATDPELRRTAADLAIRIALDEDQLQHAIELLGPRRDVEPPRFVILRARVHIARGEPREAEALLRPLLYGRDDGDKPAGSSSAQTESVEPLDPSLEAAAVFQLARALEADQRRNEAIAELTNYLATHPLNPLLEPQVAELARLNWHRQQPLPPLLLQWSREAEEPLQRGMRWLLALRAMDLGQRAEAEQLLRSLIGFGGQTQSFARTARLQLAILAAETGDAKRVSELLGVPSGGSPDRAERLLAACLQARLALAHGQIDEASDLLQQAAAQEQGPHRRLLHFNRGEIGLLGRAPLILQAAISQLQAEASPADPAPVEVAQLRQDALAQTLAETTDPTAAGAALDQALSSSTTPGNRAAALLGWISWALSQPPANIPLAELQRRLDAVEPASLDPEQRLQWEEFAFWIALRSPEPEAARDALETFAARHPEHPRLGPLRLELAQTLYNRGDYAGALVEYDRFAADLPEDPSTAAAHYGAALATLQLPTADALRSAAQRFGAIVADSTSPFRADAVLGQVQALQRLGEDDSALGVLELALSQDWPPEQAVALRCQRAEVLAQLGPARAEQAVPLWQELIKDSSAPTYWRERAAYQLGRQLESNGDPDAALALYRRVVLGLSEQPAPDPLFYLNSTRAALDLLERSARWSAAAALADHAAQSLGSPLGNEFAEHAKELRLRHFLE